MAKDSKTLPKSHLHNEAKNETQSTELQNWQRQVVGLALGFEIICCWWGLSTANILLILLGVGGAIGFAVVFFHRQIQEKYLAYQGQSGGQSVRQFTATPKIAVPEESLLLWLLVIVLALIAFISLDLATHTSFSLLAIPFSIAGSLWSYRRRHLANHWLTHLVFWTALVLMVFCLGSAFWAQTIEKAKHFLGTDRDLVLPLACSFLLVAIQTVRMWSLCYKQGLSSSVVISVMLMAGMLAIGNNPGFLLALALFVSLLVPTLMLFYRSVLKLQPIGITIIPRPQQLTERHVPWQYLTKIAALALVLGCILALFAPHLRLPEISWNFPGLDQLVKNLPIETDPSMFNTDPNNSPKGGSSGSTAAGGSAGNSGMGGQSNPQGLGQANGEVANSQPSADAANDSGYIDEQQVRQAIKNILATADRPLKTRAERIAYLTKYLQEHISTNDCTTNSLSCAQNFRLRSDRGQDGMVLWHRSPLAQAQLSEQIPLRSYYVAQQPTSQPSSLLEQLTVPCPVDQQGCYKDRVFQADRQEANRTRKRLLRSIGGIDPMSNDSIQGTGSPGSGSSKQGQGNKSLEGGSNVQGQDNGSLEGSSNVQGQDNGSLGGDSSSNKSVGNQAQSANQQNQAAPSTANSPTTKTAGKNPSDKDINPNVRATAAPRKLSPGNQSKPSSPNADALAEKLRERQKSAADSAKPPVIKPEQLLNFLRVAVIILLMILGIIWYLWQQNRQDKVLKQKERKFNQRPSIERIYLLMLKELRTSGSIKRSTETEWEFVLSSNLQYPGLLGKLIAEISSDYIAWYYGKKPPNETSLNQKFERFRELHSAELAKQQAATNFVSHSKKILHPVK